MKLLKYQEERVELIKILLSKADSKFILKGGTALLLYYGLDRYSEDIDLDSITEDMSILKFLSNPGYKKMGCLSKKRR